jgi:ferritin-like metal-binding protein YciE
MPEVQSLRTHLITELRDLLDAEQQLTKVLRDFADHAATPALRTALDAHLQETEGHLDRLNEAFTVLQEPAQPKRCEGMQGLIREGNSAVGSVPPGALRDAVMITLAQKIEHYEMASYGTARTYAQVLGEPRVAQLLAETLEEEKAADAKLTDIAATKVNEKAAEEWHQDRAAAGLLEHTAALAGQAVGVGALSVKRAAAAIGLSGKRESRSGGGSATTIQSAASTVKRTVAAASETLSEGANSAVSEVRRITKPIAQSARQVTGGRTKSKAIPSANRQRSKTRTRR